MMDQRSARLRRWSLALGTSIVAMGAAAASPASAQCTPDPTVPNGTTTCSGTDSNGLTVSTSNTNVVVATGATVRPGTADAAITSTSTNASITVNGLVDGAGKPGLFVTTGPATTGPCDPYAGASVGYCVPGSTQTYYPSANATIAVAAGATVTGSQALLVRRATGNSVSSVAVLLNNAGTMTGTAGAAVIADQTGSNGTMSVTNAATGTIGGITGAISYLTNGGTVDGGTNAALATTISGAGINNTGRIVSNGAAATLSGTGYLYVTNGSDATIGGSTIAIRSGGALSLTNAGTINGSVVSTAAAGQGSTIDTRQGTINGNLTLGAGNDTLRALYDAATRRVASITGTVDGGAGIDTLAIGIDRDATLASAVLPTNFELLGLDLSNNAAVTLAPGYVSSGGVSLGGTGTVINQAALTTSGPAVTATGFYGLAFTNQASIAATLTGTGQAAVGTIETLTNTGTITANGGDGARAFSTLINSGTITASGTAAATSYGTLTNSGSIRSTAGIGASVFGVNLYTASSNSGSITGATTGVSLSQGRLVNSGTVSGGTTGVTLSNGTLVNQAGGVIRGGTAAVTNTGFNANVVNAGIIDGAVNLATATSYDSSNDVFVDNGGTVTGAIRLGGGDDQLIVNLADAGARPLAGASGGVDAGDGYDTLRYRVNADASATLALTSGFEGLAYELDGAALTLTATAPITTTIGFAGNGSVTLNGAIATSDRILVDATILTTDQLTAGTAGVARNLTITNAGTLTLTSTQPYSYYTLAAINAGNATVTNSGTITVNNAAGAYYPAAAIMGGGTVTNTGAITMTNGGIAISGATTVVNSGTITDVAGANTTGIASFTTLTNSGTIRVDGTAVQGGYFSTATVINSGTIESRKGTAVSLTGYGTSLVNEATGTIAGVTAVDLSGVGSVINRGAITGDLVAALYNYGSTTYVADGGTVAGNVTFGQGGDLFVQIGDTGTGVSGTIDGGGGNDVFGHVLGSTGTVTLGTGDRIVNFEDALVQAAGATTVATVAATGVFAGTLYLDGDGTVINTATLDGAVSTALPFGAGAALPTYRASLAALDNRGTISGGVAGTIGRFVNSGTVTVSSTYGAAALDLNLVGGAAGTTVIANSGTISATLPANAAATGSLGILLYADTATSAAVTNAAAGTITAAGADGIGLLAYNVALGLDNAGTITGGTVAADGTAQGAAILASGSGNALIRNSGTLAGAVALDAGNDRIENGGTITGPISLAGGDDVFVQRAGATLGGTVDGGSGTDAFIIDATGNGMLTGGQFTDFERLTQTGTGTITYAGIFAVDTVDLQGGTLAVAAGQTLATRGATTVSGGNAGASVLNAGTIAGRVALGTGDDSYTEMAGSIATGGVDGGAGTDLYRIVLAGDHRGLGTHTGFEQLAVAGSGTLTLALDQSFQSIALAGAGLSATLGGFTIGRIDGSAAAEQVAIDGDVAAVALGAGDDALTLGAANAGGRYDGGAGADALRFAAAGPVTLAGTATGFETVALAGGALTVAGTLGSTGGTLAFGNGDQSLTIAAGGTLAGTVDLGAGNDGFRVAAGGTLVGTVSGGAGIDTATFTVADSATLANRLTDFEQLVTEGRGTFSLAGNAFTIDSLALATDLSIAADASLATRQLNFGASDDRFTIAGGFAGSVAGGAGTDTIDVSGGSAGAPVAFANLSDVEALRMSAGFASVSGSARLGAIALTGGRLVGYAGSTITAPTITVGTGATFGSAGTVNGNIAVNGTLSPGASPGTMAVNGNVALASGSTSLFEITPTVSDMLLVNGAVTIAPGATLQLTADQMITAGRSLDLIVASGGITGRYTNVIKAPSIFGFVIQQAGRISLLGAFLSDTSYTPQVQRSIAYVNSVLTSGQSSAALLAAVPQLADASGASNQAAFAQLTPEAYASARQIAVENGLTLADTGRSDAFASHRDAPGLFTFGSALATTRTIEADSGRGTARAQTNGYGFLGGIGWGSSDWSIGGFVGYLNSRQQLAGLGARTRADGIVAGIHGRWTDGAWGIKATIAYDDGDADTRRIVPGGTTRGSYALHGWTSDVSIAYAMPLSDNWTVRPSLGATAIRSTRDAVTETGSSAFALNVAGQRTHAAFVDGALTFSGGTRAGEAVKPYLSIGLRYQADGRVPYALAGFGGGGYGLAAAGAPRAPVLATATIGSDVALSSQLSLFGALSAESGNADHRASARAGLRFAF